MSAPLLTLSEAAKWLDYNGYVIRLFANDPYQPLPPNVFIVVAEALRQQVEAPPQERVTPCPDSELETTCRSLASGMRLVAEQINTLRRGANEARKHEIARKLFNMSSDLSSLAGMVLS